MNKNQNHVRSRIIGSSTFTSIVLGAITYIALVYFLNRPLALNTALIQIGGWKTGIAGSIALAIVWFYPVMLSKKQKVKCKQCGSQYAIHLVDIDQELIATTPRTHKFKMKDQTKVSHWVDARYRVIKSYECSECNHGYITKEVVTKKEDEKNYYE